MAKTDGSELRLVTRQQLATILGKDPRTIARWLEEGLPVAVKGKGGRPSKYDLSVVVPWVIDHELKVRGAVVGVELSPQQERARLDQRRREELELKLRVRNGELVEVALVRAELADVGVAVKSRLRAVPDSVAEQIIGLTPAVAKALLLARIDDALRELARGMESVTLFEADQIREERAHMEVAEA